MTSLLFPVVQRHAANPLLDLDAVQPSAPELQVIGVFNPGACRLQNETILLVRIAEMCAPVEGWVKAPVMRFDADGPRLEVLSWQKDGSHRLDVSDPRLVVVDGQILLTSISHLRVARSTDGVHFQVDPHPFLFPAMPHEAFGVEDCRITQIDDTFYITYTGVSADGFGVCLATTHDFVQVQRHGMILPPQNKNTCLLPEKIDGHYVALHRPLAEGFSQPAIWYAESPDLRHWGNHSCLLRPSAMYGDQKKIGVGPQPLKTNAGWLMLYHGCAYDESYSLFLALLDRADPRRVLKRSKTPLLRPTTVWERKGFFANVVFCNGWVRHPDGRIAIYYGAADTRIALAETTEEALLQFLDRQ